MVRIQAKFKIETIPFVAGWGNSAINPFLYAAYSPSFRAAFFDLTIGKARKICARLGKCCGCRSGNGDR